MSVIWSGITEEGAVVPVQVTEEGKVVAVGDGPQGDYLPITGGELTGTLSTPRVNIKGTSTENILVAYAESSSTSILTADAKLSLGNLSGGGNIILKGSDGSAEFKSQVRVRGSGDDNCFIAGNGPDSSFNTVRIKANGSGEFNGTVTTGDGLGLNGGVVVSNTGTIELRKNSSAHVFRVLQNGADTPDIKCEIKADGSSTFAAGKCGFTSDGELIFSSRGTRYKLFVSQGVCQAEEYTRQMELKEKAEQFIADKRETKPSTQPEVTPDNDNA